MGWARWMMAGMIVWGAGRPDAQAAVRINEVLADPAGDANRDGEVHATRDEFVELVNTDASPVSIAQWSLSDLVRVRHVFSGTASIPPHGFFVVFGGGAPQGFGYAAAASTGGLGLNNAGDTVTLRDAAALPIDAFLYGSEGGRNASLTRSPDATGSFALHAGVEGFERLVNVEGAPGLPVLPEPSSLVLMGLGLFGLPVMRRWHHGGSVDKR
jgi:hypothetical protein